MQKGRSVAAIAGRIAAMFEGGPVGFHVAFETVQARRHPSDPDTIEASGFLLLDDGKYALVTAMVPASVFWQMKAMDILAVTRHQNRRRVQGEGSHDPFVGSVWLVEGELGVQAVPRRASGVREGDVQTVRRLRVTRLHALERVALGRQGPRLIESFDVSVMLPAFEPDAG